MREKSRFQHEDTHSHVKPHSGTYNTEEGEKCTFCGWKYSHYFELLKKNTFICLIKNLYFCFLLASRGVMSHSNHEDNSHVRF